MTESPRQTWEDGWDMAAEIVSRHPKLFRHVPALSDILFVLDTVNEPTSKGNLVPARLSKIAGKVIDFIDAGAKTYMLEWFQQNTEGLTRNQRVVLMAQQLLLFEPDGDGAEKITGYDVVDRSEIQEVFGLDWQSRTRGDVQDILEPDFEWGRRAQHRIQMYDVMAQERAYKKGDGGQEPRPGPKQMSIEDYQEEQKPDGWLDLNSPTGQLAARLAEQLPVHTVVQAVRDVRSESAGNVVQFPTQRPTGTDPTE